MGPHTFDVADADRLEDAAARYRYLSEEELLSLVNPTPEDTIVDLGSGTGFYTDSIAAAAGTVLAIDIQPAMQHYYVEKGLPRSVQPVVASVSALPVRTDSLDGAVSTMTFHEFATGYALEEVARILQPGGTLVVVDWNSAGTGSAGPPLEDRWPLDTAVSDLEEAGFSIQRAESRRETWLVVAVCQ